MCVAVGTAAAFDEYCCLINLPCGGPVPHCIECFGHAFAGIPGTSDIIDNAVPNSAPWVIPVLDPPFRPAEAPASATTYLTAAERLSNAYWVRADLAAPHGVLNSSDVNAFVTAFLAGDMISDLAAPAGILNSSDVSAVSNAVANGMPDLDFFDEAAFAQRAGLASNGPTLLLATTDVRTDQPVDGLIATADIRDDSITITRMSTVLLDETPYVIDIDMETPDGTPITGTATLTMHAVVVEVHQAGAIIDRIAGIEDVFELDLWDGTTQEQGTVTTIQPILSAVPIVDAPVVTDFLAGATVFYDAYASRRATTGSDLMTCFEQAQAALDVCNLQYRAALAGCRGDMVRDCLEGAAVGCTIAGGICLGLPISTPACCVAAGVITCGLNVGFGLDACVQAAAFNKQACEITAIAAFKACVSPGVSCPGCP